MGKRIHIYVRVWAGEWCDESLSRQFSFVSENSTRKERARRGLMMKCRGPQIGHVTSRRGQDMYTYGRKERSRDQ